MIQRRRIAYLRQHCTFLSTMKCLDNALLEKVELRSNPRVYPSRLSGGEAQRLAIACTLSKHPNMKEFGILMMVMLTVVCLLMIFLIYSRYISQRKREICLLRVNGLSKKEVFLLILTELICQTLLISVASIALMIILYGSMMHVIGITISIHLYSDLFKILAFAFLFYVCTKYRIIMEISKI